MDFILLRLFKSLGWIRDREGFQGMPSSYSCKNPDHVESGCKSLLVNGQAVEGDYIPKELLSEQTEIELTM